MAMFFPSSLSQPGSQQQFPASPIACVNQQSWVPGGVLVDQQVMQDLYDLHNPMQDFHTFKEFVKSQIPAEFERILTPWLARGIMTATPEGLKRRALSRLLTASDVKDIWVAHESDLTEEEFRMEVINGIPEDFVNILADSIPLLVAHNMKSASRIRTIISSREADKALARSLESSQAVEGIKDLIDSTQMDLLPNSTPVKQQIKEFRHSHGCYRQCSDDQTMAEIQAYLDDVSTFARILGLSDAQVKLEATEAFQEHSNIRDWLKRNQDLMLGESRKRKRPSSIGIKSESYGSDYAMSSASQLSKRFRKSLNSPISRNSLINVEATPVGKPQSFAASAFDNSQVETTHMNSDIINSTEKSMMPPPQGSWDNVFQQNTTPRTSGGAHAQPQSVELDFETQMEQDSAFNSSAQIPESVFSLEPEFMDDPLSQVQTVNPDDLFQKSDNPSQPTVQPDIPSETLPNGSSLPSQADNPSESRSDNAQLALRRSPSMNPTNIQILNRKIAEHGTAQARSRSSSINSASSETSTSSRSSNMSKSSGKAELPSQTNRRRSASVHSNASSSAATRPSSSDSSTRADSDSASIRGSVRSASVASAANKSANSTESSRSSSRSGDDSDSEAESEHESNAQSVPKSRNGSPKEENKDLIATDAKELNSSVSSASAESDDEESSRVSVTSSNASRKSDRLSPRLGSEPLESDPAASSGRETVHSSPPKDTTMASQSPSAISKIKIESHTGLEAKPTTKLTTNIIKQNQIESDDSGSESDDEDDEDGDFSLPMILERRTAGMRELKKWEIEDSMDPVSWK
jgi:hypothetical protein